MEEDYNVDEEQNKFVTQGEGENKKGTGIQGARIKSANLPNKSMGIKSAQYRNIKTNERPSNSKRILQPKESRQSRKMSSA